MEYRLVYVVLCLYSTTEKAKKKTEQKILYMFVI